MHVLRTPDERFVGLLDYAFAPNYLMIADADGTQLRIHYVDEGPRDATPILLMHGEPDWSYLYRKFIPSLAASGHRVIAPDLIGFGRSDKPAAAADYTYERHVDWMSSWLEAMDLTNVTLFCQDWGGLIGLRLVARFPHRFERVIAGNTGLPVGTGMSEAFRSWCDYSQTVPVFPAGEIVNGGCLRSLSEAEKSAYDAPFPDETFKQGARMFPLLVPTSPGQPSARENEAAWEKLAEFGKPFLTCFSDADKVTQGGERAFIDRVRGARHQPHVIIKDAGHFFQEDKPAELVALIQEFIDSGTG